MTDFFSEAVAAALLVDHGGEALVAAESVGDVESQLQGLLAVQPTPIHLFHPGATPSIATKSCGGREKTGGDGGRTRVRCVCMCGGG